MATLQMKKSPLLSTYAQRYVDLYRDIEPDAVAMIEQLIRTTLGFNPGAVGPDFTMNTPEDTPLSLSSLRGKYLLIDFWASWCGPCRQAFRHMDQLYRTYKGDGLDMIAVSVDDDAQAARRFWAMAKPRFPVAWDGGGEVRERFSVSALPTTVLFDPNGFLVQRNEGFDPADHRLLEEHVHRLLRSS